MAEAQQRKSVKTAPQVRDRSVVQQPPTTDPLVPVRTGVIANGDHFRKIALAGSSNGKILLTAERTDPRGEDPNTRAIVAGFLNRDWSRLTPNLACSAGRSGNATSFDANLAVPFGDRFLIAFTDKVDGDVASWRSYHAVLDSSAKAHRSTSFLRGVDGDIAVAPFVGANRALLVWDEGGRTSKLHLTVIDADGRSVGPHREYWRSSHDLSGVRAAPTPRGTAIVLFTDRSDGLYSFEVDANGTIIRSIQPVAHNQHVTEAVPVPLPSGETMIIGNLGGVAQCILIGRDDRAEDYQTNAPKLRSRQLHPGPITSIRAELLHDSEVLVTGIPENTDKAFAQTVGLTCKPTRGPRALFDGGRIERSGGYLTTTRLRDGSVMVVGYVGSGKQAPVRYELF
jgi:hypothetical protein